MEHRHLDAAALEHLLADDRTAKQNEQLFHLLAVCPRCREVGGWLLELHQANALPPVFGLIDAALARSRAEAPRLLEELFPFAPEERLARLHADQHFVSWGLCELLVRRSCQTAPEQPSEAVHLADLAVHVADRSAEGGLFEESWVYQLRSLAWAALGNARRVQGDLTAAERSFDMADSWWEAGTRGTEDALGYEPILLDLKGSLRLAQRRFPEAFKLLADAVKLFLHGEHRDPHRAGRSLIKKAGAHIEHGDTESAIQALKKANVLIDPAREPRLLLCIRHNLADNLSKAGRHREADALLPDLRELAATHGSAQDRVRLDWVEGRVAEEVPGGGGGAGRRRRCRAFREEEGVSSAAASRQRVRRADDQRRAAFFPGESLAVGLLSVLLEARAAFRRPLARSGGRTSSLPFPIASSGRPVAGQAEGQNRRRAAYGGRLG